jgi:hypothetical protein
MGEVKCRFITTDAELDKAKAPELKQEPVILEEWLLDDGYCVGFVMQELSTGEHDDFDRSDKVYDGFNQVIRLKPPGTRQYEWLARTTRDGDGQRVWVNAEDCRKRLEPLGKSITNKMVTAANKVNYGDDNTNPDEAVADAEGNSEEA